MDVEWTYSGKRFASVGADKKVLLWEPHQSTPVVWLDAHSDVVENCTFLQEDFLVTSGRDKYFYVWNTQSMVACTDPMATIVDKRVREKNCKCYVYIVTSCVSVCVDALQVSAYNYRGSSRTRGWVNTLCIDEKGEYICLVTSQLLNSFVVLKADFHDYDW